MMRVSILNKFLLLFINLIEKNIIKLMSSEKNASTY